MSYLNPKTLLERIKQVDGAGSGLDADLLQGNLLSNFLLRIPDYDSGWITVSRTSSNIVTLNHNLGVLPKLVIVQIKDLNNNVVYTHIGTNPRAGSSYQEYQQPLSVVYDENKIELHIYNGQYLVQWWHVSLDWIQHDNGLYRVLAWK